MRQARARRTKLMIFQVLKLVLSSLLSPFQDSQSYFPYHHEERAMSALSMKEQTAKQTGEQPAQSKVLSFDETIKGTEKIVAGIWARALKKEGIGFNDKFLEVGGSSLSAMSIITHLKDAFGVEVPLQAFFRSGTAANISLIIASDILSDLETISEEQAQQFLSAETAKAQVV